MMHRERVLGDEDHGSYLQQFGFGDKFCSLKAETVRLLRNFSLRNSGE